jgi:hypothetical protein
MYSSSALRSLAALVIAVAAAFAIWLLMAGSSGAGETPGPVTVGTPNACVETRPGADDAPIRTVFGKAPSGKPEMTTFSKDGSYEVTRCAEDGTLIKRQLVVPAQTPDGPRMIAADTHTPTEAIFGLVPADYTARPDLEALWHEEGAGAVKETMPPTPEPTSAGGE